jgi:hypothetical protein
VESKVCAQCRKLKPLKQYYSYPVTRVTQHFAKCMECIRQIRREHYRKRKEALSEGRNKRELK